MVEALKIYTTDENDAVVAFPLNGKQAQLSDYTFTVGRMGSATLTATLMYPRCLDNEWTHKEYVEFRGEKYYIFNTPSSSKSNADIRYKHELIFTSERVKLDFTYFFDVVFPDAPDVDAYVSNNTKFTFYGDIKEFATRLNYSLQYSNLDYRVVVDEGIVSEPKAVSFEDKYFSEVLQEIFNTYDIPYYFVGKTIHIGYTDNAITHRFRYGFEKELLSINKTNADYFIVNRCTGFGSSNNIPYYYPNDTPKGEVTAIAGDTNVSIKTEDITVDNNKLYQSKIKISEKVEYKRNDYEYVKPQAYISNDYNSYPYTDGINVIYPRRRSAIGSINESYVTKGKLIPFQNRYAFNVYACVYLIIDVAYDSTIKINFGGISDFSLYESLNAGLGRRGERTDYKEKLLADSWYIDLLNGEDIKIVGSDTSYEPINLKAGTNKIRAFVSFYTTVHMYDAPERWEVEAKAYINIHANGYSENWYHDNQMIKLSDIGISITKEPSVGDYFVQEQVKKDYMPYQEHLMPSIYRDTKGKERFYNAKNNTYIIPDTDEYYHFENEYLGNNPREKIVSFEDIQPTIREMENASGQLLGEIADIAFDDNDNDEINEEDGQYEHPYFYIRLNKFDGDYGFNIFDQAIEGNNMVVSMISGNCAPCEFEIVVKEITDEAAGTVTFKNPAQVDSYGNMVPGNSKEKVKEDNFMQSQQNSMDFGIWLVLRKDASTYPDVMPNATWNYRPSIGDKFVLLNINMPKVYILDAENRLKEAIIKYMSENNSEKFNFSINFKRTFFAKYPEILEQVNENARLHIEYNEDENGTPFDYTLYVNSMTYKVSSKEPLPEITVDLVDTITIEKNSLQKSIDSVKQDIMNQVGSGDFLKSGLKYFIRKDTDDYANGHLVFNNGLYVNNSGKTNNSVVEEGINSLVEEDNALTEESLYTEQSGEIDITLGGLSNVSDIVDGQVAANDVILIKKAGSTEWTQEIKTEGGGGTADVNYNSSITNKEIIAAPSWNDINGKKLSDLEGKPLSEIFDMILFTTLYPSFIPPSATIYAGGWGASGQKYEVGIAAPQSSAFTTTLNRGSIVITYPDGTQDTSQGYRAGEATGAPTYTVNGGSTFPANIGYGLSTYKGTVNYAQGNQPKDNKGNNYGSPLPAGSVSASWTLYGGYYYYAGNGVLNQSTMKKSILSSDNGSNSLDIQFDAETKTERWTWWIPNQKKATKIEYYDTGNNTFVDDKMSTNWQVTTTSIGGVSYSKITNNNPTTRGQMRLRLTLTNA